MAWTRRRNTIALVIVAIGAIASAGAAFWLHRTIVVRDRFDPGVAQQPPSTGPVAGDLVPEAMKDLLKELTTNFQQVGKSLNKLDINPFPGPAPELPTTAPPPTEQAIEQAEAAQARPARVVIEVDRNMEVGHLYEARLIVSRHDTRWFEDRTPEPSVPGQQLPVAYKVRARASSQTITVTPADFREETLTNTADAIWSWKIEPKQKGDSVLTIELEHAITVGTVERFVPVKTFPQPLIIDIGWVDYAKQWTELGNSLETLFKAMAAAFSALFALFAVFRPKKPEPPAPPAAGAAAA